MGAFAAQLGAAERSRVQRLGGYGGYPRLVEEGKFILDLLREMREDGGDEPLAQFR
jgi:hypothetical protein